MRRSTETSRSLDGSDRRGAQTVVLVLLSIVAIAAPSLSYSAEHDPPVARNPERPRFAFDAGAIWQGGEPWVEVEIAVPYSELMFRPEGERLRAAFDLIVILQKDGQQLTGDLWHEVLEARTLTEARSTSSLFKRLVTLRGVPGDLKVVVEVSEQASGNEGRLEQEIEIADPKSAPLGIGKIWFTRCTADSLPERRPGPGDLLVGRRFGTATGPVCAWAQVHAHLPLDSARVRVHWKIVGDRRETAVEDRLEFTLEGDSSSLWFRLPVESLWLGGYELWVEASAGGKSVTRVTTFDMDETMVSLEHNPSESIALVRYIATADEIQKLEEAAPTDRGKAWDEFWQKRDPTPETEQNEFKEEFFRRVRYANENFSSLGSGWRTDRGMIYIQYGPPDQVESYPHNVDGPPYEVWYYYDLRKRFVFIDYDGFGRYELYTPGRIR